MKRISARLRVLVSGAAISTLALVAACSPPGGDDSGGEEGGPLSIGFIAGLTGVAAGPAADMRNGFELYWDEIDNTVAGRDVKLIVEDDKGEPDVGLSVARRLVEREDVDVVVGPHFANVGLAVAEYLSTTATPMIYPIPASGELLRNPIDTMFLAGGTAAQYTHPLGTWAAEQGAVNALTISSDYTFGHEIAGGFANTFTDHGGKIAKQLWPALGTTDYGPFVSQISSGDYDVVFNGLQAADSVVFQEAWVNAGLNDGGPLLVSSPSTIDQSLIRTMEATAEGTMSTGHFAEGKEDGETAKFVAAYEKKYDQIPGYYAASGYFGAQLTAAAIEELDGEIPDAAAFIDAASSVALDDSVFGPVEVDENGNINLDIYLRKVEQREDGAYWNVVQETFSSVPPQSEYDYEAFLERAVYNRDDQGTDWPESCDAYADAASCPLN